MKNVGKVATVTVLIAGLGYRATRKRVQKVQEQPAAAAVATGRPPLYPANNYGFDYRSGSDPGYCT